MIIYIIFIILFIFILVNIVLDQISKNYFKEKNFPPNIVFDLDESIELPDVEKGRIIPKKIYRCHKSKKDIEKYKKVIDETNKLMPEYEQIIYDDDDILKFIKDNFNDRILKAYLKINPKYGPARADLFRYLIIYLYGGVYLDIKSGPINRKINNLLENENKLLISYGSNYPIGLIPWFHIKNIFKGYDDWSYFSGTYFNEYVQWFVISPKGNTVIKKIIQQVITNIEKGDNIYKNGNVSVVAMSGPITFTKVILEYGNNENSKFYYNSLNGTLKHNIIDYKKIEGEKHYSKIKDKNILL